MSSLVYYFVQVDDFPFLNSGIGLDWPTFKKRESPREVREALEKLGLAMRRYSIKHFAKAVSMGAVTPLPATVTRRK